MDNLNIADVDGEDKTSTCTSHANRAEDSDKSDKERKNDLYNGWRLSEQDIASNKVYTSLFSLRRTFFFIIFLFE